MIPISAIVVLILILLVILASAIKIVREYERGVIFRLGRLLGAKGPGLFFILPIFDNMVRIDLREHVLDVPSQEAITADNVPIRVNAVVYFRVMNPEDAVVRIQNYMLATSQMAQTTLRSVIGEVELDEVLREREKINRRLQTILDERTDEWGVKVTAVEIKDVEIPQGMQQAMAKAAEAERGRRARIISAEGELQAAEKLAEAARVISKEEGGIQLRFLQTAADMAATSKGATTILLPLPIELLKIFESKKKK
ncbi:MAG: slipin family protein [Thermoplasmata archaeon]|nr:slipin family protein [Thermoplasmata archaeon]RLF46138.1 MAG: slipin family protein [Thermoplasmata archaeon]RLF48494.1 MAG: slipin family protein [Thermoplasmata archaeon]RLF63608.1 MAG: slipin family protein [Thermoplasmata archaeon]